MHSLKIPSNTLLQGVQRRDFQRHAGDTGLFRIQMSSRLCELEEGRHTHETLLMNLWQVQEQSCNSWSNKIISHNHIIILCN